MYDYLGKLISIEKFFQEYEETVKNTWFGKGKLEKATDLHRFYCFTPKYCYYWQPLYDIISICDMFGIEDLDRNKKILQRDIEFLHNPNIINNLASFNSNFNGIKEVFIWSKEALKTTLSLLEGDEVIRLNEALNCYVNECNYSTIVMCVSAIEFRLLSLMMSKCPEPKLEKLTLGDLIREYLDNKEKYANVIPKKYQPLLDYCNTYRVLSVHPKKEEITRSNATSIIYMTFSFLLDEKLKSNVEEKKS